MTEPLYGALKKEKKFIGELVHIEAMQQLKGLLPKGPRLRKPTYIYGLPILFTMNTNLSDIGWVVYQDNKDGV